MFTIWKKKSPPFRS
ncbi:rCG29030, partial [Rattus norvegicus]